MRIRRRGAEVIVSLAPEECGVLTTLATQTIELIGAEAASADPLEAAVSTSGPVAEPIDPALGRLFPAAYRGDEPDQVAAAAEFRRLMTDELQQQKAAALSELVGVLPQTPPGRTTTVRLTTEEAEHWLGAINDVRLVLGVRLDVQEDMSAYAETLTADDPRLPLLVAYDFLTYLQQSMIEAVDPDAEEL